MQYVTSALFFMLSTSAAFSGEVVLGLGVDDVLAHTETSAPAFVAEYHSSPFFEGPQAAYSFAVAAQLDSDQDIFLGAGLSAQWHVKNSPWFIEGSFMPGLYTKGTDGTPLNGKLQFRTLIGLGYELNDSSSVSLALDHKSNARLKSPNPGSETLVVRYRHSFR